MADERVDPGIGGADEVVSERRLHLDVLAIGPWTLKVLVAFFLHPSSYINVKKIRKLALSIPSPSSADCSMHHSPLNS